MTPRLLGACLLTPLLGACAFLMDFDELQKGNGVKGTGGGGQTGTGGDASASGGSSGNDASPDGSGGSSGAGGTGAGGGGGNCPTSCADTDPCTVDTCEVSGCVHTHTPGVVLDGLSGKIEAPAFHRVTIGAHKSSFYVSSFGTTAAGSDVVFHTFSTTDDALSTGRELSKLGNFNGRVPVSAAGIAATTNGLVLSVFVAMGQTLGAPAQVWELTIDPTFGVKSSTPAHTDDDYEGPATAYPVAWSPSGTDVIAAWPGTTSGVYMHHAGSPTEATGASPAFAAPGGKVTHVAPLAAGALPGVVFVNSKVSIQALGQLLPITLGGCDARPGSFTNAISAYSQVDGIWIGGWTKTLAAGGWVSEMKPLICSTSGGVACLGSPRCEATDQPYTGIRNPTMTFLTDQNDPVVGRVFEIIALPYVNTGDNAAGIGIQMLQVDFDVSTADAGVKTKVLTPTTIPLVSTTIGANSAGPDWPTMAFLPPDHLAIAWIQPAATAGQEVHVERHKVCFPK